MKNKKAIWALGILCLVINIVSIYFFINRNSWGNFTRAVSYNELYSPGNNAPHDLKKWKHASDQYTADQLQQGKLLAETLGGVKATDSLLTKIIKIGSWLRRSFSKCEIGRPSAAFAKLSSLEQYKIAARAESPVWCGTYGSQFLFFCYANNITARYIETFGDKDNHVINEAFAPEISQWVYVDLFNNVLYCQDSSNRILNTADILYLNSKNRTSVITAFEQKGSDSMLVIPLKESNKLWQPHLNIDNKIHFYYTIDLQQVYSPVQKIIRYIYPKTWFEIFTLTSVSNNAFYCRLVFLYTGLILLIIFIPLYLKKND
ncbi:MAG: hypothetical protein ACXWV8_12860 [Chitinophagaceae bacterium]